MKKTIIIILSIILLIIIPLSVYLIINHHNNYNKRVIKTMNELDKENSSKTLDIAKKENKFIEKYSNEYQKINYINRDNFINDINTLLKLNYSPEEINNIFQYLNEVNLQKILSLTKQNLNNYFSIKNFEVDKITLYEEYQKNNNCSLEEAVLKVNIGLDHDFYTQIKESKNLDSYTVLVNKYNSIGEYEPKDLKSLSYDSKYQLREMAALAFEELVAKAKLENLFIRPYSAYRSYATQNTLYNKYVARDGKNEADTYSARPGHSEHQTGLAVDVWSEGYNYIKENDAQWLKDNSYKYGFIVRYTKENQNITGYIEEPWHLRYLGVDVATDVIEKNLTFDEYYDLYLK